MMRTLDKYIVKKFLSTFIFTLLLFLLVIMVIDFAEKLEDFLERNVPFSKVFFVYYVNFIPSFANLITPLCVFIAVIYFTSRMAERSEVIAVMSSGVNFYRLLVPYLATAGFITILFFTLKVFVLPHTFKKMSDFEYAYIRDLGKLEKNNVHRKINSTTYIYVEYFNGVDNIGYHFGMDVVEEKDLVYRLSCDRITWDAKKKHWLITNATERTIRGVEEHIRSRAEIDTVLSFTPKDFVTRELQAESMTLGELGDYIRVEKARGSDTLYPFLVEFHKRYVFSFAVFVLTIIGVSFSIRKRRGGIGLQIGTGLALAFAYLMLLQLFTSFSRNTGFPVWIAMWTPNVAYSFLCIWFLRRATK